VLSEKSVLIVEDSALIAVDIESILAELGATDIATEGGGETRIPESRRFDLAVIDIHTASTLGESLIEKLGQESIPVVFLTTGDETRFETGYTGRSEIVRKPFTYEDLCGAFARLLG